MDITIRKLIDISVKKEKLLNEMLQYTELQNKAIDYSNINVLENRIAKKNILINEINTLDMEFLEEFNKIKRNLNVTTLEEISIKEYPMLKELKEKINNILECFTKIKEIDDKNIEKINGKFEDLKEKMKNVKGQRKQNKVAGAYIKRYASMSGMFVDSKRKN